VVKAENEGVPHEESPAIDLVGIVIRAHLPAGRYLDLCNVPRQSTEIVDVSPHLRNQYVAPTIFVTDRDDENA